MPAGSRDRSRPMSAPGIRVVLSAQTDLGRTRDHNEDTFLVADLTKGTTELVTGSALIGPRGSLFMVADGMGGAAAGEVASAMATDIIFRHLLSTWSTSNEASGDEFTLRIREAVELANERIHGYAREHPDVRGMGTTATVVGVFGSRLHLAQVGDSRAYLIRQGSAVQLTKDQSLMQRLIDAGEMTEEQAAQSERRNIILQALGPDPRIRVDVTYQDLSRNDVLVICSDGLSGQVRREEIAEAVTGARDVDAAASRLIDLANDRGGPDNITVVVVRFEGEGLPEAIGNGDLGYHTYPLPDPDITGETPIPAVAGVPPPAAVEPAVAPPVVPAERRSGNPMVIAGTLVALLAVLALLFYILA
jgi:PPM family protein phosphatase